MKRNDIDKLDFTNPHDKALLCAYLCTISYQNKNDQKKWLSERFELEYFESDVCYDTLQYYVIYDTFRKYAFVVVRGTDIKNFKSQWKDLLISFRFWPKKISNSKAHNGYVRAGSALIRAVEDSVSRAEKADYKIVFTGHSLGGVLAKYIACMLNKKAEVYTFGAPCLARNEFYHNVSNIVLYKYRMEGDLVPMFPSLLYDDIFGIEFEISRANINVDTKKRKGVLLPLLYLSKFKLFSSVFGTLKSHNMKYYALNLLRKHKNNKTYEN